MALDHGTDGTPMSERPEFDYPDVVLEGPNLKTLAALGATLAGGTALLWGLKRRG